MIFHIWDDGDASVGIPRDTATLDTDVDCYDGEDRDTYINSIKESLQEAFSSVWSNGRVYVATEEELMQRSLLMEEES